jgi:transglutaminase-like putative cysteine protease
MNYMIDTTKLAVGLAGVRYEGEIPPDPLLRVHISRKGAPEYHYKLQREGMSWYPLQYGPGEYTVQLLELAIPGSNAYRSKSRQTVTVGMEAPEQVFLQSHVNTEWHGGMECIKLARKLALSPSPFEAIWRHISGNFSYDLELAQKIIAKGGKYDYIPDIEAAFASKKDICFGLTALFNAMLRSVGIASKMNHGQSRAGYHAWSEVWLEGRWVTVDVTFDIAQRAKSWERRPDDHSVKYFY